MILKEDVIEFFDSCAPSWDDWMIKCDKKICKILDNVGVKKGSKTIKATGHSFGAYKTVKKATCTQNGKKVRTCKLCKKEQSAVIDKKGHNYSKSYTVDKKATFSSDGSRSLHCSRCDSLKNKTTIPRVSKIKLSKTSFSYDGKTKKPLQPKRPPARWKLSTRCFFS